MEEWLKGADEARDEYLTGKTVENNVYGTCENDMTRFEVALMMGEMYRAVTGADIAWAVSMRTGIPAGRL